MSTITATADAAKSQVRLDLDFSDIDAPYVLVNRVDALTGATTAVRGHGSAITALGIAYAPMQAGYKAVLYDTEAPLDASVYYTATAPVATLNANPDFEGGYTEPWFVPAGQGITIRPTANTSGENFLSMISGGGVGGPNILAEDVPATPGATLTATAVVSASVSQGVTIGIDYLSAAGAVLGSASGTATVLATTTITCSGVAPASTVAARLAVQMTGTPAVGVTVNVASITLTNAAGSATSGAVVLSSLGSCQLKDPLRPGNNVRVDFSFDPNPLCTPTEGVFWQSLDADQRAANSATFNINNQADPVVVSKVRSSPTNTLTLVSRTFADRDRLNDLFAPGTPVLFQVPDQYGVPDRYMSIATTSETRVLPDHKIPIRVFSLPHAVCAAPGGPMQGTVGARWSDTCNRYATWAAVNAAGLTWIQVLDGLAG